MTLSVFPSLLAWSQISPLLIRLALGAVFIYWAYQPLFGKNNNSQKKTLAVIEAIIGILLVIGLWSQVAALAATIELILCSYKKITEKAFLTNGVNYYLILLVLALSLLVTGAGFFSIDLPL